MIVCTCLNVSVNYGHLKSTRPVAGKSRVAMQGSGCDARVGVSRE